MTKRITKEFLARICGVDKATVSLALNNHARVAEPTRLRIQAEARRLGYTPNHAARQLAKGRFGRRTTVIERVGVVFFGQQIPLHGVYMAFLSGVEQASADKGGIVILARENQDRSDSRLLDLWRSGVVDGLLLVGSVDDAAVRKAQRTGIPFVVMGDYAGSIAVNQATVDYSSMGRLAVRHLAERGHRRIGFVGASMRFGYQCQTRDGVKAEMESLGLPVRMEWFETSEGLDVFDVATPARKIFARRDRPTALVVGEPHEAANLLGVLAQAGVRVPDDVSVVFCESSDVGPFIPESSHVDVFMTEVGAAAVTLLRQVAAEQVGPPRCVLVPPRWVKGTSVKRRVA